MDCPALCYCKLKIKTLALPFLAYRFVAGVPGRGQAIAPTMDVEADQERIQRP